MNTNYNELSLDALMKFLDWAASKGMMKLATVNALKAASNKVLGILEEDDKNDLSKINFNNVFDRFKNLNGQELSPTSLKTYRSRTQKAINEFLTYKRDPKKWKPSISQRTRQTKLVQKQKNIKDQIRSFNQINLNQKSESKNISSLKLYHNFPLRNDIVVTIEGLPLDLKLTEAKRLSAFLLTLCEDYQPEV